MGRNPAEQKPLAVTKRNTRRIAASLEQATARAAARHFFKWAGMGLRGASALRLKRGEKFPLELHEKVLATIWPRLYAPKKRQPKPAHVTSWAALVALRARRFARSEELWCDGDVIELERTPDRAHWSHGTAKAAMIDRRQRGLPALRVDLSDEDRRQAEGG